MGRVVKRSQLARKTPLRADVEKRREFIDRAQRSSKASRPRAISPASPHQREAIYGRACLVCGAVPCHPAHLIDRSLCPEGADDRRAVVPLCAEHHRLYDLHRLSLLEWLEPHWRVQLAWAVERFGLLATLNRVTGERWAPVEGTVERA